MTWFKGAALSALLLCGCVAELSPAAQRQLAETQALVRKLQELVLSQSQRMVAFEEELSDGLSIALCRPELRQLLEDVQRECSNTDATASCTTKQIHPAVIAADPEHKGRFLKLLAFLRHEVIYVPQGRAVVTPQRKERLQRMARQALLRNTVILVISHPEASVEEATRRAEYVEGMLHYYGIPKDKIKRWLYAYPATPKDIERPSDRPSVGEPAELMRGVWVFRADC